MSFCPKCLWDKKKMDSSFEGIYLYICGICIAFVTMNNSLGKNGFAHLLPRQGCAAVILVGVFISGYMHSALLSFNYLRMFFLCLLSLYRSNFFLFWRIYFFQGVFLFIFLFLRHYLFRSEILFLRCHSL